MLLIIPSIVVPVVLILAQGISIEAREISILQHKLLSNNVSYIISKMKADFAIIEALGMADEEYDRVATQKGVMQEVAKNLVPDTSVYIIDTQMQKVIFSAGRDQQKLPPDTNTIRKITEQKSGQIAYQQLLESGESSSLTAVFEEYSTWNWIIVSYMDKNRVFRHFRESMYLLITVVSIFLLFIFIGVYKLSNGLSQAIMILEAGAKRLSANDLDVEIQIKGGDELVSLADSFNLMAAAIKQAENKLKQSILEEKKISLELLKSRQEYQYLIERTPDLITRVDRDGRFMFVNHAAEIIFGLPAADCIGRMSFDFIHPEDKITTQQAITLWQKGSMGRFNFENRQVGVDGQEYDILWSISPECDADGKLKGFISTGRDISEQKSNENVRAGLEDQLHHARKMDAVGQLAGGVAHDFNNMLGVIIGHAELALKHSAPLSASILNIGEILKAAKHSAQLTRQLLTFARKQTIKPQILSLNDSVTNMLTMLERLIGENIELSFVAQNEVWPVLADPAQIDQIIANLCVNARDAIYSIGTISIETRNCYLDGTSGFEQPSVMPKGEYVRLTISDDGSGMKGEVLEHIFEPFFTTKKDHDGIGLGLATVFGAVNQNHGYIEVTSKPAEGSVFAIYLPRAKGALRAEQPIENETIYDGNETILLVEDNLMLLEIETIMLEQQGYKVLAAATIGEATTFVKEYTGQIQLLLTDVIMPEMNGKDLADSILISCPEIKVLFISGFSADIITNNGVIAEDIHFLQKPFSNIALSTKVREVLDEAQRYLTD
ncbi:MAG: two-component system cell cycle sensor histidine kinase/response regulator CckA [Paraglaciecola sp.]